MIKRHINKDLSPNSPWLNSYFELQQVNEREYTLHLRDAPSGFIGSERFSELTNTGNNTWSKEVWNLMEELGVPPIACYISTQCDDLYLE